MKLRDNLHILRKVNYNDNWYTATFLSGKRLQEHNVAATLVHGRKIEVEKTTLQQSSYLVGATTSETERCDNFVIKDKNPTFR